MSWVDKLKKKKQSLKDQYNRGKVVTEQIRADKLRKRKQKMGALEPGMVRYGLTVKQHPVDFMKDSLERRQRKRKEKQEKKQQEIKE